MAEIPFAPPVLYGHRPSASIRDLILMGAQERARAAERSGEIWANALGGVGQAISGGLQAYGAQKEEQKQQAAMAKRDEAAVNFVSSWQGDDPKELMVGLMKIGGPEYAQKFGPIAQALKSKPTQDSKSELQGMYIWAKTLQDPNVSDAMKATMWEGGKARFGPVAVEKGLVPGAVFEGEWTPDHAKGVSAFVGPLGEVLGIKGEKPAGLIEVSAGTTLYDPTTKAPVFTALTAPGKPEKTLAEIEAESAARARGTASVKPPAEDKPIARDVFNPETGEMETKFIMPADALAMARGEKPGLSKGPSTSTKNRMDAARTSIEAGEALISELKTPEFAAEIGPVIGRYNSLTAAAGAGDPKAQYLVGALRSFSALQPAIHGFRAVRFAEDIEKLLSTKQTPEALAAGLKGILTASYLVAKKPQQADHDALAAKFKGKYGTQ